MNLKDLDRTGQLRGKLVLARRTLDAFERFDGETVPSTAYIPRDPNQMGGLSGCVDLLPVPKSQAVSAAKREVSKIVEQLAHLGVEVDEPAERPYGDAIPGTPRLEFMRDPVTGEHSMRESVTPGVTVGGLVQGR